MKLNGDYQTHFPAESEEKEDGFCKKHHVWIIGSMTILWLVTLIVLLAVASSGKDTPNKIKL